MEIPIIGAVTEDPDVPEWLVSQPTPIPFLRGHKCRFVLEGYPEDPQKDDFHSAFRNVLAGGESILVEAQDHVFDYYEDMAALCVESGWPAPPKIRKIPDVWKHVRFGQDLHIKRLKRGGDEAGIYVSLECGCDWEEEHGLQIVLRDGLIITKVGPFDGHLTNAHAFADPSLKGVVYKRIS